MKDKKITTQSWVWRSMVKTGIIPLILVESVLIAVYLISNHFISAENMEYIYTQVNEELKISSEREVICSSQTGHFIKRHFDFQS